MTRRIKQISLKLSINTKKRPQRKPSLAEQLPEDILDEILSVLGDRLADQVTSILFAFILDENTGTDRLINLIQSVLKLQASVANASIVSRAWKSPGIRVLYSRPFLYSHDSYWEFIAALTKNPRLAHALHHPSIVFHARAVLPFSPSRQTEHWWQKRRNTGRLTRGATAGLAKVLVLCSNLQGVTYYSRQREVSYELPPDLFNNSCVGRTMTLAACLQDGLAFPPACTLTTIEELCITGVRLVRCLPHLPKLRSLVLAKCKLDPTHFSGPLFRSEDHSQCIQHIQLLANDKDVVALLANVVTGRSTIEGLALVGEHEVVALDSFFGNLKLLSSLTKLILDSRGSAALYATGRSMPFFRTLVLVILGATSNVTSHLVALANLIESGRCPYLEEISVNNYSVASYAEEANVIALNRMEAWCNYHHSAIKVLQIREPQSEREWIHAHLTGLRKAGGHW